MRFIERLDPEYAELITAIPRLDLTDIPAARVTRAAMAAEARAAFRPDPRIVQTDHVVPGVPGNPDVRLRQYRSQESRPTAPCLYWIHGGGHVLGGIDQDDELMQHFVGVLDCVAISVDWRRAPENPFPAALNDCYAGLQWVLEHAEQLGVQAGSLAVGGASSGGGSAAGLALLARDRGRLQIGFQLLIYPMLDDRGVTDSSRSVGHPNVWNTTSNRIAWAAYLGDFGPDVSPYAAPSRASGLTGLPPAFIATGELDLFCDEDVDYAQRLMQAGVSTELHVYAGAIHGFDLFAPHTRLAQRLSRDRDEALERFFHSGNASESNP
jgi:acetyl esterase/lipase